MRFFIERGGIVIGDNDARTLGRQQVGDGFADSVRSGVNEGELSLKLIVHR